MSAVKFNAYFSKEATPSEGSSNGLGETAPVTSDSNEAIPDRISEETVPENDALARTRRIGGNPGQEERILFIENYGLIWENRERIINDEALFETRLYFAGLSLAYISGGSLTLGMLLTLWNNGEWTTKCPFCGGAVRIFGWGGSPLTGNNKYHGFCTSCKRYRDDAEDNFLKKVLPAIKMIDDRRAKFAGAHPHSSSDTIHPKVVHYDFRSLSKKWTEYEKDPEKIPASTPKKTIPEKPEDRIWYSQVQWLIDRLNDETL